MQASRYFKQAIELDPQFALANASLAAVQTYLASNGALRPKEAYAMAKATAAKAEAPR